MKKKSSLIRSIGSKWQVVEQLRDAEPLMLVNIRGYHPWHLMNLNDFSTKEFCSVEWESASTLPLFSLKRKEIIWNNGNGILALGPDGKTRTIFSYDSREMKIINAWLLDRTGEIYFLAQQNSERGLDDLKVLPYGYGYCGKPQGKLFFTILYSVSMRGGELNPVWAIQSTTTTSTINSALDTERRILYARMGRMGLVRITLTENQLEMLFAGFIISLTLSPQGRTITSGHDMQDNSGIIELGADMKGNIVTNFGWFPSFSPDGRIMAFTVYDRELWLRHQDGELEKILAFDPRTDFSGIDADTPIWCPCGGHIAVKMKDSSGIVVADVRNRKIITAENKYWGKVWVTKEWHS